MKLICKRTLSAVLALFLLAALLPVPALAADEACLDELAEQARDTDFFTPRSHTDLNYGEIAYERPDAEALIAEADALRELCRDAKNEAAFRTRFLALADRCMQAKAMAVLLFNRQSADSRDNWVAEEYETCASVVASVWDAFDALVRDALASPCAAAFDGMMSENMRRSYLGYEEVSEEELALHTRQNALMSEYRSRDVEEYTAAYNGEEYTDESAYAAYLSGALDFSTYWDLHVETLRARNAALGDIYLELVDVCNQIAALAGYGSYAAYAYRCVYLRDYTPEDAQAFCDAVKKYIVPKKNAADLLVRTPDQSRMPQDVTYSGGGMFDTLFPYFAQVSDELLESARYTYEHKAYDVEPSPSKTGTAHSVQVPYYNIPFFFSNAYGSWLDLKDAIHELGHCNAAYWLPSEWNDPSFAIDTSEVHSQGLELLMLRFYPELFGEQSDEAYLYLTDAILDAIVEGCLYDEFQREVFETPDLTLEKVNRIFRRTCEEYGLVDADDERTELYSWCQIAHNFLSPMYYISYASSGVGAFAFWDESQEDWYAAVDDYLRFVALGYAQGFSDTFRAVGMEPPMSEGCIASLAESIRERILPIAPYTDVYADDWFGAAVIFVNAFALMNGVGDGLFAPADASTREQSMTVLARLDSFGAVPLSVDEGVAWAVENGVSDGEDRAAVLTREQFVTMLYRYALSEGADVSFADVDLAEFTDASEISDWAADAMRWAVGTGILNGTGDGALAPGSALTRAQMAMLLCLFCAIL